MYSVQYSDPDSSSLTLSSSCSPLPCPFYVASGMSFISSNRHAPSQTNFTFPKHLMKHGVKCTNYFKLLITDGTVSCTTDLRAETTVSYTLEFHVNDSLVSTGPGILTIHLSGLFFFKMIASYTLIILWLKELMPRKHF